MPLRRFLACRAHFGAHLAVLNMAAHALPLLRPSAARLNACLARYTDRRARQFDLRHGTETFERVPMKQLGLNDPHGKDFENWAYGPICADFFNEIMRAIPRRHELAFLDVGSGKGLPLLLAGNHGFPRVIGIEMSRQLCDIARQNIERCNARSPKPIRAEIVCEDFLNFDLGREPTAFFLNNPFPHYIAQSAMMHIEQSAAKHPRRIVIAYRRMPHPTFHHLQHSRHFKLDFTTPYWQIFSTP